MSGSVQATDRLMKELRDIYRSPSFKGREYYIPIKLSIILSLILFWGVPKSTRTRGRSSCRKTAALGLVFLQNCCFLGLVCATLRRFEIAGVARVPFFLFPPALTLPSPHCRILCSGISERQPVRLERQTPQVGDDKVWDGGFEGGRPRNGVSALEPTFPE